MFYSTKQQSNVSVYDSVWLFELILYCAIVYDCNNFLVFRNNHRVIIGLLSGLEVEQYYYPY